MLTVKWCRSFAEVCFVLIILIAPLAHAIPCDVLKAKIQSRLHPNASYSYDLTVIPRAQRTTARVVGTCDQSQRKVVMIRHVHVATRHPMRTAPPAPNQEWESHLNWCEHNATTDPGETNCPEQYGAVGAPWCILGGGRACLMKQATYLASQGQCLAAFHTAMVCQCHNSDARNKIKAAGQTKVCEFLTGKLPIH